MVHTTDFTITEDNLHIPFEYLEQIKEQGLDGITELIRVSLMVLFDFLLTIPSMLATINCILYT